MAVVGMVVESRRENIERVRQLLLEMSGLSIHEIVEGYKVVTVLEGDSISQLKTITEDTISKLPGVLGVYPAYIACEDQAE